MRAQPTATPGIIVTAAQLDPTARCEPFNSTICNDVIPPGSACSLCDEGPCLNASVPIYVNSSAFPQAFLEQQAAVIASTLSYSSSSKALTWIRADQLLIVRSLFPDCAAVRSDASSMWPYQATQAAAALNCLSHFAPCMDFVLYANGTLLVP